LRDRVIDACCSKGLLLLPCGMSSIRFTPAMVVNAEQIDTALGILRESIQEARASA